MIHFSDKEYSFSVRYASIIAASVFSLLTLAIRLIFARAEGLSPLSELTDLRGGNMLRLASLFTLCADWFLVAAEEQDKLSGMIFFLGTQLCISLHVHFAESSERNRRAHLLVRLLLSLAILVIALAVLGESADALAIISVIYYANLLSSMIFAPFAEPGGLLLTVGLALFALCDINVGLNVLQEMYGGEIPEGSPLYFFMNTGLDLAWLFYLPSQALLALTPLIDDAKALFGPKPKQSKEEKQSAETDEITETEQKSRTEKSEDGEAEQKSRAGKSEGGETEQKPLTEKSEGGE